MASSKMKTRAKGSTKAAAEATAAASSTAPKVPLGADSTNPPKIFILPKDTSPKARIVTLAHPRIGSETRYYWCPGKQKCFYEFTKISEPKTTPRSCLLIPLESDNSTENKQDAMPLAQKENGDYNPSKGYVTKSAEMYVATPIDPLFLLIPVLLQPSSSSSSSTKRLFLSPDDYFDALISKSPHYRTLLQDPTTRQVVEERMKAGCDTVDAGDELMYRLSEAKLLGELVQKANTMVRAGLPASMEEKLVRKALEVPVLSLKRDESSLTDGVEDAEAATSSGVGTPAADSVDSQISASSSADTQASSVSMTSTAATSIAEPDDPPTKPASSVSSTADPHPITAPDGIPALLRLHTALTFILTTYLPPSLHTTLLSLLPTSPSSPETTSPETTSPTTFPTPSPLPDFSPLTQHLAHLARLRLSIAQSRSHADFSLKRPLDEDAEGGDVRAEKKRRKEEEERKRRAGESRGVRDLKKVDVRGMRKMSDFFGKKG